MRHPLASVGGKIVIFNKIDYVLLFFDTLVQIVIIVLCFL
jgi:hypothetical protein